MPLEHAKVLLGRIFHLFIFFLSLHLLIPHLVIFQLFAQSQEQLCFLVLLGGHFADSGLNDGSTRSLRGRLLDTLVARLALRSFESINLIQLIYKFLVFMRRWTFLTVFHSLLHQYFAFLVLLKIYILPFILLFVIAVQELLLVHQASLLVYRFLLHNLSHVHNWSRVPFPCFFQHLSFMLLQCQ